MLERIEIEKSIPKVDERENVKVTSVSVRSDAVKQKSILSSVVHDLAVRCCYRGLSFLLSLNSIVVSLFRFFLLLLLHSLSHSTSFYSFSKPQFPYIHLQFGSDSVNAFSP